MAVDVSQYTTPIKTAVSAREVRNNIANGIDAIASEVNTYEEQLSSDNDQFKEDITSEEKAHSDAEAVRVSSENTRKQNENTRQANETNRQTAEQSRATAENNRETAFAGMTHIDANLELSSARTDNIENKTYDTLGKRLDAHSSQLAEKANQTDLNTANSNIALKANQTSLDTTNNNLASTNSNLSSLQIQVSSLASGSPKGTFATLPALQADTTANTTDGKKSIYVVTADGKWYYWNGSAWTAGGTYQSTGIADQSITVNKLADTSDLIGKNKFDKSTMISTNLGIDGSGNLSNNGFWGAKIPVIANTQYSYKHNDGEYGSGQVGAVAYLDASSNVLSHVDGSTLNTDTTGAGKTLTTPASTAYVFLNVKVLSHNYVDDFQLELGNTCTEYGSYEKYTDKITGLSLADLTAREEINKLKTSYWSGKKANILGDSFTSMDVYTKTFASDLGLTYNNYGVGGSRITQVADNDDSFANRCAGMDTTADLIIIMGGTNDTFLPSTIGTSTDTVKTTFYGALNTIMNTVFANHPNARVIFVTPTITYKGNVLFPYADAILDVCKNYSVPCLNLAAESGINMANLTRMTRDQIHPTDAAFIKIGHMIADFVNKYTKLIES